MYYKQVATSLLLLLTAAAVCPAAEGKAPKRVFLLGQRRDHPPTTHEYMAGLRVLAKALEGTSGLEVSIHRADEPWTEGPELLKQADAIVMFLGQGSRWEQTDPKRLKALEALAARGGGIVAVHWAIGGKDAKYIAKHLELVGGCHGGPDRKYTMVETDVKVVDRNHPITFGIDDCKLNDEYYYRLKFATVGKVVPLLEATIDGQAETAAWAFERPDGGRSFGFCGMHYHDNWRREDCRRLIVQGLLWTLKMPIPKEGLPVDVAEEHFRLE